MWAASLEELAAARTIDGYGVATWSGFSSGAFTVPGLLAAAREAAGGADHHLKAIQLPVSLVSIIVIAEAVRGSGPIAQAAAAGLEVWASAPLHGAELVPMVRDDLATAIRPGLPGPQAALLAVASVPGMTGLLLSTNSRIHLAQAQEATLMHPLEVGELADLCDLLLNTR